MVVSTMAAAMNRSQTAPLAPTSRIRIFAQDAPKFIETMDASASAADSQTEVEKVLVDRLTCLARHPRWNALEWLASQYLPGVKLLAH